MNADYEIKIDRRTSTEVTWRPHLIVVGSDCGGGNDIDATLKAVYPGCREGNSAIISLRGKVLCQQRVDAPHGSHPCRDPAHLSIAMAARDARLWTTGVDTHYLG